MIVGTTDKRRWVISTRFKIRWWTQLVHEVASPPSQSSFCTICKPIWWKISIRGFRRRHIPGRLRELARYLTRNKTVTTTNNRWEGQVQLPNFISGQISKSWPADVPNSELQVPILIKILVTVAARETQRWNGCRSSNKCSSVWTLTTLLSSNCWVLMFRLFNIRIIALQGVRRWHWPLRVEAISRSPITLRIICRNRMKGMLHRCILERGRGPSNNILIWTR